MAQAEPDATAVAAAFGLGGNVVEMSEVGRAWSNRVYRLTVGDGAYAVKEMLNPWGGTAWHDWLMEACDWDVAAPLVPRRELADVAMSMAAWQQLDIARLVVASYRAAGGEAFMLCPQDLGQSMMIGLDWIVLNVERALQQRGATDNESAIGRVLVPGLLARLPSQTELAMRLDEVLAS